MDAFLLFTLFGFLSGVTTALFGFGGGFVVVPLVFQSASLSLLVAGHSPDAAMKVAVATSACVMIFGSLIATWRHHRLGSLDWSLLRPLFAPIGVGAAMGAYSAVLMNGVWLRWAFMGYLAVTILDNTFRPGFLHLPVSAPTKRARRHGVLTAITVGWVASLLGVGGSVMTVPMLRRSGVSMAESTAMAVPLTLSVALGATCVHAVMSWAVVPDLGEWFIGYIDVRIGIALALGSWLGIQTLAPLAQRISDRWHARAYVAMLALVLLSMFFQGQRGSVRVASMF